jgi:hypothetical protein
MGAVFLFFWAVTAVGAPFALHFAGNGRGHKLDWRGRNREEPWNRGRLEEGVWQAIAETFEDLKTYELIGTDEAGSDVGRRNTFSAQ